ncbi:unnamed protein product [Allacma fusca]|uniref:Guanylate cyclase domain-containing protein n=1 Tax=Allacma fusca TaxID=39272 RepID=A0A8J2Q0A4_9HEXA|nr:unnamed protein product [Allacma fusca]
MTTSPKFGEVKDPGGTNTTGKTSATDLTEFVGNKIELMKQTQTKIKRAALVGGFVPDYILMDEDLVVPSLRKFHAVVFMTDISGFTALTEAYSLKGKGGTDNLTKTLASYMGPLAECILRIDGDIIKFAGDAFLSVWEFKDYREVPELLQKITDCALYCQEKYGSYVTDVHITIRVKIGIGVGECYASGLGDANYHHYAVYGPGVYAASGGEHMCESGDVVLHPSAWQYCNPNHFMFSDKGEGFKKVTDIIHFLDPSRRGRPVVSQRLKTSSTNKNKLSVSNNHDLIRPHLDLTYQNSCEDRLRKYVIPPVIKKLDNDVPLGYLNESRMVSIVFIHVDYGVIEYTDREYGKKLSDIVQRAFLIILKSATSLNGCLTKVIMFDKGLTYLVVFGLPGYMQDNQVANSLNFAYRMKPALRSIDHVQQVSIGCTTGSSYCGILGHPRRHEYTVIGKKVNKAARLMCYYPGKVTCDQDTYYSSKLPGHYFQQLEAKALKGISNVGLIFEYLSSDTDDERAVKRFEYPILNRRVELDLIANNLRKAQQEFRWNLAAKQGLMMTRSAVDFVSSGIWMMVVEGENGIGKSRVLAEAIKIAEGLDWKVFSVALTLQHQTIITYAVTAILLQVFQLQGMRSPQEREEHLRKIAIESGDNEIISGLPTLNELLHLKLQTPPKFAYVDAKSRHAFAQHTVMQLIRHAFKDKMLLFCIEDAHYMQQVCWEYFNHISRLPNVMTMMTLRRNSDGTPKIPDMAYKICYHSPHVKTIPLKGLADKYVVPLACQLLEVKGIPTELERILASKSQGNPVWIEDVLNDLLLQSKIRIADNDKIPKGVTIEFALPKFITRENPTQSRESHQYYGGGFLDGSEEELPGTTAIKRDFDYSFEKRTRLNPETRLCLIKSNTTINANNLSGGLKELVLDTFDSLNTTEQLMVKCACVLGKKFSRVMLHRLLPAYGKEARRYLECFQTLMENRIFQCASMSKVRKSKSKDKISLVAPKNVECVCKIGQSFTAFFTGDYQDDLTQLNLPKYVYCRFLEFTKDNMMEVIYELLTEDLRKDLHLKAAKYLETTVVQCVSCGGTETPYIYGFVLEDADLMGGETEEDAMSLGMERAKLKKRRFTSESSIRTMQGSNKWKQHRSRQGSYSMRPSRQLSAENSLKKSNDSSNKQQLSLSTRIQGLRKTYEKNGGSQLAGIELDILLSIVHYAHDRESGQCFTCCRRHNYVELEEAQRQAEYPTALLTSRSPETASGRPSFKNNYSGVTKTVSMEKSVVISNSVTSKATNSTDDDDLFADEDGEFYDFRGCDCTSIQALVFVEIIRHYKKAEKFGKCVMHSLDAAETTVAIGNTTQALSYIEDTKKILEDIDNGVLKAANPEDPDDILVIEKEYNRRANFLQGLANYEMGAVEKAKDFFSKCMDLLGIVLPVADQESKVGCLITLANFKLWRMHHASACCKIKASFRQGDDVTIIFSMKSRTLSYLRSIYMHEENYLMAMLMALWHVILVMDSGELIHDKIPAYCTMMEMYTQQGRHSKAQFYEKMSIEIIRSHLGCEDQVDPIGLLTCANLFMTLAEVRFTRGQLDLGLECGFLVLRLSKLLHDNGLVCHNLPTLVRCLMMSLKIADATEALNNLWFTAQAEDFWIGTAWYYALTLDLILELGCPLENFYHVQQFVAGKDWEGDMTLFKEKDLQFNLETSIALWYARFSKWDDCTVWITRAETHMSGSNTVMSIGGLLKLLQTYLIRSNFHQSKKRFSLFAIDQGKTEEIMQALVKRIRTAPVYMPRYYHLRAYHQRILNHRKRSEMLLSKATYLAKQQNNRLEVEFIKHSRLVWAAMANPAIKYYWTEHIDQPVINWNSPSTIPWANILYSLPLPAWT